MGWGGRKALNWESRYLKFYKQFYHYSCVQVSFFCEYQHIIFMGLLLTGDRKVVNVEHLFQQSIDFISTVV